MVADTHVMSCVSSQANIHAYSSLKTPCDTAKLPSFLCYLKANLILQNVIYKFCLIMLVFLFCHDQLNV